MSALDQKQTFAVQKGMAALPPKAHIGSSKIWPVQSACHQLGSRIPSFNSGWGSTSRTATALVVQTLARATAPDRSQALTRFLAVSFLVGVKCVGTGRAGYLFCWRPPC